MSLAELRKNLPEATFGKKNYTRNEGGDEKFQFPVPPPSFWEKVPGKKIIISTSKIGIFLVLSLFSGGLFQSVRGGNLREGSIQDGSAAGKAEGKGFGEGKKKKKVILK